MRVIKGTRPRVLFAILVISWLLYASNAVFPIPFVGEAFSPLIAFVAGYALILAARVSTRYRLTWTTTALAACFWGLSDLIWAGIRLTGADPLANVSLMYLYDASNFCLLATILYLSFYNRQGWVSFQLALDSIAIFASICAFLWFTLFTDAATLESLTTHEAISAFVALIADMLLLTFTASVFLSMILRKIPAFLILSFIGIAVFVVADVVYVQQLFNDSYIPDSFIDVTYMLSFALLGLSAVLFLSHPIDPYSIRKDFDPSKGIINRSFLLLVIPLGASLVRRLGVNEIALFLGIFAVHQAISLILRRLVKRELELESKQQETEVLEATILDRTRELKIMNQTLENLINQDAITGLNNRKQFLGTLEEWIATSPGGERIWMIIIDFERFKTINDTYGHDIGDHVLRQFGKRLDALTDVTTQVGRLGGDEFGVIARRPFAESIQPDIEQITALSDRPVEAGPNLIPIAVSLGIACWPVDAKTRSDLMRHADMAMYASKDRRGVNGVSFFDQSLNAKIEREHQIDLALRRARFDEEFSLVLQPQYAVGGRRLMGMEALIRWNPPSLGRIPPDEFIPIAEANRTILPLSDWITDKAIAQIADWNRRFSAKWVMGINVSPLQIDDENFLQRLDETLRSRAVDPSWINLEMTERCAMKEETAVLGFFDLLAKRGIASSIDDFGTGYSSLAYLKKFNIDYLKIAKQLIDGIAERDIDRQIVQAIIMMATALELRTIAEGVEDERQFDLLASLGVDEIQGYILGKPLPPDEFEREFIAREVSPPSLS